MRAGTLLLLVLASAPVLADDAALLRCRAVADASARLACYDALPRAGGETKAPARAPAPPLAPAARPAEPRPAQGQAPAEFGLEQRQNPAQVPTIESHIPGAFEGWQPNSTIKLANGQVWQISDGSTRRIYRNNPKVTIRRGALGSFFLDVEGDNSAPRVRRLQ